MATEETTRSATEDHLLLTEQVSVNESELRRVKTLAAHAENRLRGELNDLLNDVRNVYNAVHANEPRLGSLAVRRLDKSVVTVHGTLHSPANAGIHARDDLRLAAERTLRPQIIEALKRHDGRLTLEGDIFTYSGEYEM